jgi:hypothetical protein
MKLQKLKKKCGIIKETFLEKNMKENSYYISYGALKTTFQSRTD